MTDITNFFANRQIRYSTLYIILIILYISHIDYIKYIDLYFYSCMYRLLTNYGYSQSVHNPISNDFSFIHSELRLTFLNKLVGHRAESVFGKS
jgi:hypothetical protein